MPHSFELSAEYEESVEEVHRAFQEEGYWLARLADIPVDEATLESMRVGGESGQDGTVEVVTLQVVRSHNLHAVVKQLHRGDICIRRKESWGPLVDGTATGSIAVTILDTPANVSGTGELAPIAGTGGARLTSRITVQVRIPIIGGKVERLIGAQLDELVSREQRLTAEWIAQSA
ncbi:hypothetical protein A5712_08525 [Mycobacterium sp. E2327]|uniref:DUF2505 domain-containing protein n=1 Tax=Mycobacterium sp. E2327 TaxID=1834132 RepID=UPI0007FF818B|nr:DUF2505 domain-containing protein [Mycobacterium sp. E2327]OBI12013.1 hypothetical protein A5712_08525 [Mycobacterium sp. E2327]